MATKRKARPKAKPAPARRLRPAKIDTQHAEARAYMQENGYTTTEVSDVPGFLVSGAIFVWPDDPAVIEEHAEMQSFMAEYRTAFG